MADSTAELERGRSAHASRAWGEGFEALSAADGALPLGAADLERLATCAFMLGREDDYLAMLERAHGARLDQGRPAAAVRDAFWIGLVLALRGEQARAGGWLGRARRLLEREGADVVETGYLLLPRVFELSAGGERDAALATAAEAAAVGERFGDADLFALATQEQGNLLVRAGRQAEGLALLDEAMVSVTAGELSPIVAGIVYCGVILACREAHEVRRAGEWTAALTRWCEQQDDLVAFTGQCSVHRAELMQLRGAWAEAVVEAGRARERALAAGNASAAAEALYRQGELHALRGELEAAERAFAGASREGREAQPGLARVRMAQGKRDAAAAAIRRVVRECEEPGPRSAYLPDYVEIMVAVGDLDAAREGCDALERLAAGTPGGALEAMGAQARGTVALAEGEPGSAISALRRAAAGWRDLGAPYGEARARELIGAACRALGDEDTAELELEAARHVYRRLAAAPDLARLGTRPPARAHGLSERELEVLGRLASGETNRAIAGALVISERTVDRHVSNIFAKLGVSSRSAATAFAYEHALIQP